MPTDASNRKLAQARFHLDRMRAANDARNQFEVECYFAACLAATRSVAMYVHEWQIANGKATGPRDWAAINAWIDKLPAEDIECWRAATDIRNHDIHQDAVAPVARWVGGYFGGMMGGYFGGYFGEQLVTHVTNPKKGDEYKALELCERALAVSERLLAEHASM